MQRKYLIKKKNNNSFIEVRDKHSHIIQLQLENIDWIHAEGNYSIINTVNQRKFVRKISLFQIMDSLDDRFVQVQKSYVINKDYINNISVNKTALVINDTSIPIGRSFRQSLFLSLSENKLDN